MNTPISRYVKRGPRALSPLLLIGLATCGSDAPMGPDLLTFSFDFNDGPHGWIADFVDFPPAQEGDVGFTSEHRFLPPPLDGGRQALYHRGLNLSDDLFMYYKRNVGGLEPGGSYRVNFRAEFATTIGNECGFGLALFLKAGAVAEEPRRVIGTREGWYRLSADKGIQTDVGSEALLLGEMHNTDPGCTAEFGLGELGRALGP